MKLIRHSILPLSFLLLCFSAKGKTDWMSLVNIERVGMVDPCLHLLKRLGLHKHPGMSYRHPSGLDQGTLSPPLSPKWFTGEGNRFQSKSYGWKVGDKGSNEKSVHIFYGKADERSWSQEPLLIMSLDREKRILKTWELSYGLYGDKSQCYITSYDEVNLKKEPPSFEEIKGPSDIGLLGLFDSLFVNTKIKTEECIEDWRVVSHQAVVDKNLGEKVKRCHKAGLLGDNGALFNVINHKPLKVAIANSNERNNPPPRTRRKRGRSRIGR